jgi:hypothetical protein
MQNSLYSGLLRDAFDPAEFYRHRLTGRNENILVALNKTTYPAPPAGIADDDGHGFLQTGILGTLARLTQDNPLLEFTINGKGSLVAITTRGNEVLGLLDYDPRRYIHDKHTLWSKHIPPRQRRNYNAWGVHDDHYKRTGDDDKLAGLVKKYCKSATTGEVFTHNKSKLNTVLTDARSLHSRAVIGGYAKVKTALEAVLKIYPDGGPAALEAVSLVAKGLAVAGRGQDHTLQSIIESKAKEAALGVLAKNHAIINLQEDGRVTMYPDGLPENQRAYRSVSELAGPLMRRLAFLKAGHANKVILGTGLKIDDNWFLVAVGEDTFDKVKE